MEDLINHWAAVATGVTAISVFAYGVWKYLLIPVSRLISDTHSFITDALPVLVNIADQFQTNGGKSLRDVIDRIEIKLAHNYSIATILLQESADAIFVTDGRGHCTWVNDTYTKWTGLSLEQSLGRGWHEAIALKDRELVYNEWEDAIKSKANFTGHYWWTDGVREFPVRCRTKLTIDHKGKMAGAIGIVKRLDDGSNQ